MFRQTADSGKEGILFMYDIKGTLRGRECKGCRALAGGTSASTGECGREAMFWYRCGKEKSGQGRNWSASTGWMNCAG